MAREIETAQRRAHDLYNRLISPMWNGREPEAAIERIRLALAEARRDALREAAKVCRERASGLEGEADMMIEQGDLSGPSDEYRYAVRELRFAVQELDRLASEGV